MALYMMVEDDRKIFNEGKQYRTLFRFNQENVLWISQHFLGEESGETRGGSLTNLQKLQVTLRFLSDPGYQAGIALDMGVHQSTVSRAIFSTMQKIIEKERDWVIFPTTREQQQKKKIQWYNNYQYPSIIGAIDCTHVKIKKPPMEMFGDDYVNRKGYPSINVQVTCDANCIITSFDASSPGSVHDQRIFKLSNLYPKLLNTSDCVLIGDEGYALTPFLMVPYKDTNNDPVRINFNRKHCAARIKIEHTFGQLKSRFPVLHYGARLKLNKIPTVISTAIILHNVAKHLKELDDFEPLPIMPHIISEQNEDSLFQKGCIKRDQIARTFI